MRDLRACWQFAILGFALLGPTLPANCQTFGTPGLNAAVFNSGLTPSPSYDLVDATQFSGDICARISSIFSSYNTSALIDGVVIDARGVPTANLNCNSGDGNPWASLTADFSSVVLLPAGTITIAATWILPSQTWLLGEGPDSTIITAQGMSGDMIDMGAETTAGTSFNCAATGVQDCPGILIEHLGLNGGTSSSSV